MFDIFCFCELLSEAKLRIASPRRLLNHKK
nr:MAG TPA: hypothetical protein [Inoviridae sp.]